ncbi:hypothetical protein [Ruminococcus sp. 5_1_39BFAA]|uniref:hypothetical protein n=1 Tax=Ruminococcus sp. 5_1_39BFAA TaxID=457412 RepID=UPI0035680270
MMKWENVTHTFTEEQRHYKETYLEICEVYDGAVEVSLFSAVGAPYELYLSYGRMYGIVYVEKENADIKREEIKKELEQEYQRCKEPTGEFINDFAEKYKLCLPNDALFDADDLFDMF